MMVLAFLRTEAGFLLPGLVRSAGPFGVNQKHMEKIYF